MPNPAEPELITDVAHDLRRAQEPEDLFRLLKDFGFTDADIAQATNTQARSVRRWKTAAPGIVAALRLAELRNVAITVRDAGGLTDRGLVFWMRHPNRLLEDYAPLAVLGAGGFRAVQEAALCFVDTERGFTHPIPASLLAELRRGETAAEPSTPFGARAHAETKLAAVQ